VKERPCIYGLDACYTLDTQATTYDLLGAPAP
jgi:hypothetical protein